MVKWGGRKSRQSHGSPWETQKTHSCWCHIGNSSRICFALEASSGLSFPMALQDFQSLTAFGSSATVRSRTSKGWPPDHVPRDLASMEKGLDEPERQLPSELTVRVRNFSNGMKCAEDGVDGGEVISEFIESGREIRGICRVIRVATRRLGR